MAISKKKLKEIQSIRNEDIDYSDIPETDAEFWKNAELVHPDKTKSVTLRVKQSILDHFKADGIKGYQTRINAVLESYVRLKEQQHGKHDGN